MIDETSGIVRTDAVLWEETSAKAESENGELQFALDHWIGLADTLKQQRDSAEKERDAMKARAEQAESEREAVYVQIECCADEIDILKHEREKWEKRARKLLKHRKALREERDAFVVDMEFWRHEWALVVGELGGAKAECDALLKDAARYRYLRQGDGRLYITPGPDEGNSCGAVQGAVADQVIDAAMEAM
jgi:chromosome segregation ATPase